MFTNNDDIERIEKALGRPHTAGMRYEIQPFEYDVVEGSMAGGRAHDVTMFIRGMEDPRLIAVIRKHFFPPGAYRAPSGAAHRGETLDRGAGREALEETGLEIELARYLVRINARFDCGDRPPISWTSHVFEARQVEGRLEPIDTDEIDEARWATLAELQGPIRRVLLETGWGLFSYRVALTDLTVRLMEVGGVRYEDPVFRPPCEAGSLIIQATIGCPHNRCTFCGMYKGKRYRVRPLAEIEEDIRMARDTWADPPSVFLADGNTIAMRTDDLVRILDCVRGSFPNVGRVSVYGGARFIRGREVNDLARLREHGLKVIYMGLESGDDEILRKVKKGASSEDYVRAAAKVREAGIELSTYVLAGLGGRVRTREHAVNSALALNGMKPDYIRIRTLVLMPGFPMYEELERGEFEECTGREIALETRILLEHLDVENAQFLSDHVSNYLPLYGRLPGDREAMIAAIDGVLEEPDPATLRPRVIRSL